MYMIWRQQKLAAPPIRGRIASALGVLVLAAGALAPAPAGATGDRVSPPVLECADANQASLKIKVCGGVSTGAPTGFVLNWVEGSGTTLSTLTTTDQCVARYFREKYRLDPGECVTVSIGELLASEANYTNCARALTCGTSYAFKGFARPTQTLRRSRVVGPVYCSTDPCTPTDTCTLTQGFWKTHGPIPVGGNANAWPVPGLTLGTINYTDLQLLSILNRAPAGNGLVSLAHQLIAAKLNVANGADPTAVAAAIAAADALIGGLYIPPVGSGLLAPSATSDLNDTLTQYNEGGTGPGHCSESTQAD